MQEIFKYINIIHFGKDLYVPEATVNFSKNFKIFVGKALNFHFHLKKTFTFAAASDKSINAHEMFVWTVKTLCFCSWTKKNAHACPENV